MGRNCFDRVKESSSTTGTGTFTLAGAQSGYRAFSDVLADGDTTLYAIVEQTGTGWEVGLGTFATSGTTLARTTILASSNSNNAVNFGSGTKDVWINWPAAAPTYLNPTAAYASLAAFHQGRIGFPSDGFSILRDSGSAFAPWGPIFPFTLPVNGDFAWINQGSATISEVSGGLVLAVPADATSPNIHLRKKTAPSTPYTITAALTSGMIAATAAYGLLFRESSSGKLHTFQINFEATGQQLYSYKADSPTVGNSVYTSSILYGHPPPLFLRIADDGTDRKCSISWNGQTWIEFHSVGRTNFLTADEVGFFGASQNGTYGMNMTLLSWKQA